MKCEDYQHDVRAQEIDRLLLMLVYAVDCAVLSALGTFGTFNDDDVNAVYQAVGMHFLNKGKTKTSSSASTNLL